MTTADSSGNIPGPGSLNPRVAVVVLTWNGKSLTLDCLESLTASTYENIQIIVVDNASTDGTADAVEAQYGGRVTVLVNSANLGFAGGNNVGIRHAVADGAEYVMLLNNDTLVDPDLVDRLVDAISRADDIGIVGPKIYYASPRDQIWYAGGEINLARGTARHIGIRETDAGQYDTPSEVDYVTGCALMVRREVIEKIGVLDTAFKAYFEDADFCMRARAHGYRVVYVPAGRVWHRISSSTGGQLSITKISLKLSSTWRFLRRYASPRDWITIPFFFVADAG
ncbi:MAG: glycosyltransferase family 2 protein, partial [bacterium]